MLQPFPKTSENIIFSRGAAPQAPLRATYASYISITLCCVLYLYIHYVVQNLLLHTICIQYSSAPR